MVKNFRTPSVKQLRQCSHLVPGHRVRVLFYAGHQCEHTFFLVPTPEFGHGAGSRVHGLDLVLRH